MTQKSKLRKLGGSVATIIPKAMLDRLHLEAGDEIFITETPGGVLLSAHDPDTEAMLDDARAFMRSHREAFKALAK